MCKQIKLVCFILCACINLYKLEPSCKEIFGSYFYRYKSKTDLKCTDIQKIPITTKPVYNFHCLNCKIEILDENNTVKNFIGSVFNMSNGHIEVIKKKAFEKFSKNVQYFLLENNKITDIEQFTFRNFRKLLEIILKNNSIAYLKKSTFEEAEVVKLDLSYNRLLNASGIFYELSFRKLNLSFNDITDLPDFCKLKGNYYDFIDFSSNKIRGISSNFVKCESAKKCVSNFYFHQNWITTIENYTFFQMPCLKILQLGSNQISTLQRDSFKGLTNLFRLELQNNQITSIPRGMFRDLSSLHTLDLSTNLLTSLEINTFTGLVNLFTLNISHNTLPGMNEQHLLPLGVLRTLDISSTNLHNFDMKSALQHHVRLGTILFFSFRHFNVPNLHGIACSPRALSSYDDLTFEDFLRVISEGKIVEDIYDIQYDDLKRNVERNLEMENVLVFCLCALFIRSTFQLCEETFVGMDLSILTCTNGTQNFPPTKKMVVYLKCLDCNIPVLDEKTVVKKFVGDVFNLSNSHVRVINSSAFKNFQPNMRRFLFRNNEINYISPRVFSRFISLEEINFRYSRIYQLEPDTFSQTQVIYLDLSQNLLWNVSSVFDGLKVTAFNLSSNRIKAISENTFDKVTFTVSQIAPALTFLDLSNNLLQRIPPNAFKSNELYSLHLGKNFITTIESKTFANATLLRMLLLKENHISQLYFDSFKGLVNLLSLDLKKNRLQKIPTSLFADLRKLEALDLSQNSLSALDGTTFSGLQNLKLLNLSHNNLKVFENGHLFPLVRLQYLDITDTRVHEIDFQSILLHHWRLLYFVINDNFWTCKQLTKIYKQMNHQFGGFSNPAKHFDVPNLHGIACSKEQLKSYDNLRFEDFMNIIAQEAIDPNSFLDDEGASDEVIDTLLNHISMIKSVILIIALIIIAVFLYYFVRFLYFCLRDYSIVKNGKFKLFYNQNQDTVKVIP
ncbi:hypothetical protein FQA39_LY03510 [Lamprigera yunnana]|nr:hypothetical protein FQA39_LY03510 [Lamprigera yunnana]